MKFSITPTRRNRLIFQTGFFVLFALTPVFDLFRYDLYEGHAYFLGFPWLLGINDFLVGKSTSTLAGLNILLRLFLPVLLVIAAVVFVAFRWGRIYCGWLCPHFSVVETINGLMRRASGKPSVWEKSPLSPIQPNGKQRAQHPLWWIPTVIFAVLFAALWGVILLTYLLPPAVIYQNIWDGALTANQARFITVATIIFTIEFLFARHLFCRFGCAAGVFQSLAWMANRAAMVVSFNRLKAADCAQCQKLGGQGYAACEAECPMRLRPRQSKQKMFTCTQCSSCLSACDSVQKTQQAKPLLRWVSGAEAKKNEAQISLTGHRDKTK